MHRLIPDTYLYGRLGQRLAVRAGLDVDAVGQPLELRQVQTGRLLHQQIEGCLGRLELVASVFQVLHLVEDLDHQRPIVRDGVLRRFGQDCRLAR